MTRLTVGAVLVLTSVASADSWQAWRMADAMKIVECSAIISLFEEVPGGQPWPEGVDVDFETAAQGLRAHVASLHGTSFVENQTVNFTEKWATMPSDAPAVSELAGLLRTCRAFGLKLGLPM